MKALVVTPSYPRYVGDYHGGFIQSLCYRLAKHVTVTVLAPRTRTQSNIAEPFKVLRFPYMPLRNMEYIAEVTLKGAPLLHLAELPPYLVMAYLHSYGIEADLVNTHLAIPLGVVNSFNLKKVPRVVTCHGSDCSLPLRSGVYLPFTRLALRKADRVIAVSEYVRKLAVKLGADSEKTRRVYLGVDVKRFKPKKSERDVPTIGTLGRMVTEKNIEDILLAFEQIRKSRDLKLIIGGDGPNLKALKWLAKQREIEGVSFLGRVKRPEDFYRLCDVFVLSSTSEGLSSSLQEAMASGCVPVAVKGYGCPEVIEEGVNGFLYKPRDIRQLIKSILSALDNPWMRNTARRTIVSDFNADKNVLEYLNVYREVA
jgi:glycosyltransferase involved in cell wall biosynthesis